MIKKNTVYIIEMYRETYKYQLVYDSLYPITLYGQIIEFFILRTRRYIHVSNFFMDTRHQKDELIVEFFGMLMSERSKTIRIPSLHVNKLSKLR